MVFENKKIIALIPARLGSKGIPQKNIKKIGKKTLIEWSVEVANNSKLVDNIFISTDSIKIANIAKKNGVEVPFIRPKTISDDHTPMKNVIKHFLTTQTLDFDALILLQPTSPFRNSEDIDNGIKLFFKKKADSVVSISPIEAHYNPYWQLKINKKGELKMLSEQTLDNLKSQRQKLKETYFRNGDFYILNPKIIKQNKIYGKKSLGYITEYKVNIDSKKDYEYAKYLFSRKKI